MQLLLGFLVHGCFAGLAIFLLYWFGAAPWYWHAASVVLALAMGVAPVSDAFNTPSMNLLQGAVFTFLVLWGLLAPFFRVPHRVKHA